MNAEAIKIVFLGVVGTIAILSNVAAIIIAIKIFGKKEWLIKAIKNYKTMSSGPPIFYDRRPTSQRRAR